MSLKINLIKLDVALYWKHNFPQNTDDECKLCKKNIMAPNLEMGENYLISKISIGKCGHAFHNHCAKKYFETNVSCPIDFTTWDVAN